MGFSTCPIAVVDAPEDKVWGYISNPSRFDEWWEANTVSIDPEGPAAPGQKILASGKALGKTWYIRIQVESVDPPHHVLDLTTSLPFGITVHNHLTVHRIDDTHCQLSFG